VSGLLDSEDVIGPLLTRASLRISIKRGRHVANILRDADRDFKKASKHKIVCLKVLRSTRNLILDYRLEVYISHYQSPSNVGYLGRPFWPSGSDAVSDLETIVNGILSA